MTLFNMNITMELFYLVIMMLVIRKALFSLNIKKKYITLYLLIISFIINFIFNGISIITFFESIICISFCSLITDIYKITKNIS